MPHKRAKRSVREQQRSQKGNDLAPSKGERTTTSLDGESVPKSVSRVLNAARIREEWKESRKRKLDDDGGDEDGGRGAGGGKRAAKKRKSGHDKKGGGKGREGSTKGALMIRPGETIAHFNKRVELYMAPLVKSAMRTSAAVSRKTRAEEQQHKRADQKETRTATFKPKLKSEPDHEHSSGKSASTHHRDLDSQSNPSKPDDKHPKEFSTTPSSARRRLNDIVLAPPELTRFPRPRGGSTAATVLDRDNQRMKTADGVVSMAQKAMLEAQRTMAIVRYREMKERRKAESGVTMS